MIASTFVCLSTIVDNTGAVVVNYNYDAWGNVIEGTKTPLTVGNDVFAGPNTIVGTDVVVGDVNEHPIAGINPFRYRGYYYDVETGFYYLRTRYYDPQVGRFINADDPSIAISAQGGYINGLNLYAYCMNNPVNYIDPNGTVVLSA